MSTVFPLDPEINDEYLGYRFDGTSWKIIGLRLTKPEGYTLSNATATIFDSYSEEELSTIGRFPGLPYQIKVYADTDSYSYQIGDFVKVTNTYDSEDVNPTLSASATSVEALDSSIYSGNVTFNLSEPISAYSGQYLIATDPNNPAWIQICQIITISGTEIFASYSTISPPESAATSSEWIIQRDINNSSPLPQYYQNGRSVSGTIIESNPTNYVINIQQSSSYIWESDTCTVSLAGVPGLDGSSGPQGSPGAEGIPGANGVDGYNGMDGVDGLSAYETWLNLGYYGSEQDFIDSLRGQDGVAGMDGMAGAAGVDGADGADGLGYKVNAARDQNPGGEWIFEGSNAYEVGSRIRIADSGGNEIQGIITSMNGLAFTLQVDFTNGSELGWNYYSVSIVGKPGLNGQGGMGGEPGADGQDGADGAPGQVGAGYGGSGTFTGSLNLNTLSTASNTVLSFTFTGKLAYQSGDRVRISQSNTLSNYVEGIIVSSDIVTSVSGLAPNITYNYATTVSVNFDAKGGSGTWGNGTNLLISLTTPAISSIGEALTKTTSTSITSSAATTIATFSVPSLSCIAVECVVLISSSSNGGYTTSKVLITGGAGDVDITEYAIIQKASASTLLNPTLSATISGTTISLRAAVTSFTNVTAKVISTSILSPMGAA